MSRYQNNGHVWLLKSANSDSATKKLARAHFCVIRILIIDYDFQAGARGTRTAILWPVPSSVVSYAASHIVYRSWTFLAAAGSQLFVWKLVAGQLIGF